MKTERRLPFVTVSALTALAAFTLATAAQAAPEAPETRAAAKAAPAQAAAPNAEETAVLARLRKLYPATVFGSVTRTPLKGVFEVVMGPNIAYVGADGKHFLFGHLFDMQRQVDLTALRKAGMPDTPVAASGGKVESQSLDVSKMPLQDALKTVNGTGARTLVVFSDPLCPYCKKLDASLPDLADTTIYTFLVPILGEGSRKAAEELWARSMPARAGDLAVLDRNLKLAGRLGVRGTPTLVRGDGQIEAGAPSTEDLKRWLDAGTKTAQVSTSTPK